MSPSLCPDLPPPPLPPPELALRREPGQAPPGPHSWQVCGGKVMSLDPGPVALLCAVRAPLCACFPI